MSAVQAPGASKRALLGLGTNKKPLRLCVIYDTL